MQRVYEISHCLRPDFILMLWNVGNVLVRQDEKTTCFIWLLFNFKENDAASPVLCYLSRQNVLVKPVQFGEQMISHM